MLSIQAYAEQGLLGAIGLAGLLVVGAAIGLRATRRAHGPSRWIVAGAAGGFLGSAIYGMTDQVPTNNLSLALVLVLLAVAIGGRSSLAAGTDSVCGYDVGCDGVDQAGSAADRDSGADRCSAWSAWRALAPRWISGLVPERRARVSSSAAVLDRSRDAGPACRPAPAGRVAAGRGRALERSQRSGDAKSRLGQAAPIRPRRRGRGSRGGVSTRSDRVRASAARSAGKRRRAGRPDHSAVPGGWRRGAATPARRAALDRSPLERCRSGLRRADRAEPWRGRVHLELRQGGARRRRRRRRGASRRWWQRPSASPRRPATCPGSSC